MKHLHPPHNVARAKAAELREDMRGAPTKIRLPLAKALKHSARQKAKQDCKMEAQDDSFIGEGSR